MKNSKNKIIFKRFRKNNLILFKIILSSAFLFSFLNVEKINASDKKIISSEYLKKVNLYDYILGEGDILTISISDQIPELTKTYQIDSTGTIYFPKLNRIFISGLTISELNELLNKDLLEFVKEPNVEVRIKEYRPVRVFIDGEVETPGLYTLEGNYLRNYIIRNEFPSSNNGETFKNDNFNLTPLIPNNSKNLKDYALINSGGNSDNLNYFPTVFDAIKKSGGITSSSDLSNIDIIRKNSISNGGGKITTKLNFLEFFDNGDTSQNIRIYDGDFISVGKSKISSSYQISKAIKSNLNPKFIKVFVSGRVESPGVYQVSKASTLNEAIEIAGGTKALKGSIIFNRFNIDGVIDKRKIRHRRNAQKGSYNNPYLKSGDIIRVGKSTFNIANEILSETTGPFVNAYTVIKIFED